MVNYPTPYVAPILVVDSVIFQLIDGVLSVLLIQRTQEPFLYTYALPGGYDAAGETTTDALARIVHTKAGIDMNELTYVEQLYTFDTVARDPRGHAVSVSYMGLCTDVQPKPSATTQSPRFFPVDDLPELAYDHTEIITYARQRLRSKLTYTNAAFALLPATFTLTDLQKAYEAVFGQAFDKRNFRKKYLSLNLIAQTGTVRQQGAHRPARLYRFTSQTLAAIERSFD